MRITSKGQVTIPIEIREKLGLLPNSEVEFRIEGNGVRITKMRGTKSRGRGQSVVANLRGSSDVKMTTEQILSLTRRG